MKIVYSILLPFILYGQNWSFGIDYSPLNTEKVANFNGPYSRVEYIYESDGPNLKSIFTFSFTHRLRILFNTGYDKSYIVERHESHTENNDNSNETGNLYKSTFKTYLFEIGIKYYFSDNNAKQVSPFIITGFGKQFSKINRDMEYIFAGNSDIEVIENEDEFLERLNSPISIFLGFGSEYFFNKSISILTNLQFTYSKVSGIYNYKRTSTNSQITRSVDYQQTEIIYRVGLGMNLYF